MAARTPIRTILRAAPMAFAAASLLVPAVSAAQSDIRYGDAVDVGTGIARTYVAYDAGGNAVEVGIALSAEALTGLPAPVEDSPEMSSASWDLQFPDQAPIPYWFASVDWNPRGHIPPGIYDVTHFDFHFYLVEPEVRDAILPDDPDYAVKSSRAPDATLLPAGYITPPDGTVPRMGTHWIDPSSHEFHGQPFSHTFIYGSWDGRLIFFEPMATLALLEGEPDVSIDLVSPEKVEVAGWYPTRYAVRRDSGSGEIRIALGGLVERN
jgi:hypothetical protein